MKQDWSLLFGFALAVTGCCGSLAYVAAVGAASGLPMIAGLAFGIAAQILLLSMIVRQGEAFRERFSWLARNLNEMRAEMRTKTGQAFSRIEQVESESRSRTETVIGRISDLNTSYSDLKKSLAEQVANAMPPKKPVMPLHAVRPASPPSLPGAINVSLEPVVDMRSRRTAHYRLHLSMTVNENEVSGNALFDQVSRAGLRPQLDRLAMEEALNLLGKLRQRDPDLCIIMPVGPATLADDASIKRMMKVAQEAGDKHKGLVLEIKHALLPQLTPRSLEGLAQLSRQGQAFALADASPDALDLEAMQTLHVRVVELDASQLRNVGGLDAVVAFATEGRLRGISSMITGVEDAKLIPRLMQVTPLACGPCFAEPRRVKRGNQAEDKAPKLSQAA